MIRRLGEGFVRSPAGVLGLLLLGAVVAFSLLAPALWPADANVIAFPIRFEGPSWAHPLGTDFFGRDLLARVALGGRLSLGVAAAALGIVLAFGFLYGAAAALLPRRLDAALMRLVDVLLTVPRLPVVVIVLAVAGASTNAFTVIGALSLGGWMIPARLVRGELVTLQQRPFVLAARSIGVGPVRLVLRHLLPNALGVLLVAAFLELPTLVLGEAFASGLGLGINPPTPTWGNLVYEGLDEDRVWQVFLPSVAIALFTVAAAFVADGVQDALQGRAAVSRPRSLVGLLERTAGALLGRPRRRAGA